MNSEFLNPLVGGVIIGLASTLMLAFKGRITGISGILGSSLGGSFKENDWRFAFLFGLIFGGLVLKLMAGEFFDYAMDGHAISYVIAGLLVGFGTRLGGGCTSGHGVCGLPRASARSIIATCTFITSGVITVYIGAML